MAKNQSSTQDLIRENERMAREVARAQNAQAESEKERAVAVAQLEGVELALKGEQERYDQAVKEVELARGLAETHRKQLMMEIDRVRNMDQGWEARVRVLKQDHRIELEQLQANLKRESSYNTILQHKCAQLEGQLSKLVKPGEKLKQGASVPVETPNGSK